MTRNERNTWLDKMVALMEQENEKPMEYQIKKQMTWDAKVRQYDMDLFEEHMLNREMGIR